MTRQSSDPEGNIGLIATPSNEKKLDKNIKKIVKEKLEVTTNTVTFYALSEEDKTKFMEEHGKHVKTCLEEMSKSSNKKRKRESHKKDVLVDGKK